MRYAGNIFAFLEFTSIFIISFSTSLGYNLFCKSNEGSVYRTGTTILFWYLQRVLNHYRGIYLPYHLKWAINFVYKIGYFIKLIRNCSTLTGNIYFNNFNLKIYKKKLRKSLHKTIFS